MLKAPSTRRPSVAASHVSSAADKHHMNDTATSGSTTKVVGGGGDDDSSPQQQQPPPNATVALTEGVTIINPVSAICPRIAGLGSLRAVGQGQLVNVVDTKGANNDSEIVAASRENFSGAGHSKFILSVAFSPDGTLVASGSGDQLVILWDVKTSSRRSALIGHNAGVRCVQFSHDGLFLASASSDHNCILWDCLRGNQRAQLKGHTMEVNTVAFAPDSSFLYSAGVDKTIFVWDLRAPVVQLLTKISGHTGHIHSVAASPDGNYMLSTGSDKQIFVWDVRNEFKQVDSIAKHSRDIHCLSFNNEGTQFASGGSDGLIIIWNANTFSEHVTLKGHTNRVMSVAFSSTGTLLASASMDKSIGIWDPIKGGPMKGQLREHGHQVYSVAFPKTGIYQNCLVSGSFSQKFIFWELVRGKVTAVLEGGHTKGNISKVEWIQLPEASHRLLIRSTDVAGEEFLWDAESGRTTQLERVMEQEQKLREMDDMRIHQEKMTKMSKLRQENERKAAMQAKGGVGGMMMMGGGDGSNNNNDGTDGFGGGGGDGASPNNNNPDAEFGEFYHEQSNMSFGGYGSGTNHIAAAAAASRIEEMINQLPDRIANAVSGGSPDSAVRRKLLGHLNSGNTPQQQQQQGTGSSQQHSTKDAHSHAGDHESLFAGGTRKQSFNQHQYHEMSSNNLMNPNHQMQHHGRQRSGSVFANNSNRGHDNNNNSHHNSSDLELIASSISEVRETQKSMQKEMSDLHKDVNSLHAEMKSMQQSMVEILKLLKKK